MIILLRGVSLFLVVWVWSFPLRSISCVDIYDRLQVVRHEDSFDPIQPHTQSTLQSTLFMDRCGRRDSNPWTSSGTGPEPAAVDHLATPAR